jgi:hypothetical protein
MKIKQYNNIIYLYFILFSSTLVFSQEITVNPTYFKNTILLKIDHNLNSYVDVFILNESNDILKTIELQNISKKSLKIDLSNLRFQKKYKVKIINKSNNEVLFLKNIYKTIK